MSLTALVWIMIQGDDEFAKKCLIKLWHLQTGQEQAAHMTLEQNLQGFTSGDAAGMSEWAETLSNGGTLNDRQMELMRRRLLKYCGQLSTHKEITQDLA